MSDKLQKTSTEISPAVDIADAIERALPTGDKPAEPLFTTDPSTCVWGDHSQCTGARYNGGRAPDIMCECACASCLTAQRKVLLEGTIAGTCDCIDCKRAWFSDGRPIVRDGVIVRTTPESVNPVKTTPEDVTRWDQMRGRVLRSAAESRTARVGRVLGEDNPADMLFIEDCRKCDGVGYLSMPGGLVARTCPRCFGSGRE